MKATASVVFQGTGFIEFECTCGAKFSDSIFNAASHVATWHCDSERLEDARYFEGRVATMISPNPLDFIANDLDE